MNVIHADDMIAGFFGEYRFLSNFWFSEIKNGPIVYPTVEHYYQAMKVADDGYRNAVATAKSPGEAKRLGSRESMEKNGYILRPDWEEIKVEVMSRGVRQKFFPGRPLASKLLDTGDAELIELNNWNDRTWGMVEVDGERVGQNLLGKILMETRRSLTMLLG